MVLGVNVSPGLEQVGDVGEASLLTSGVVEGGSVPTEQSITLLL